MENALRISAIFHFAYLCLGIDLKESVVSPGTGGYEPRNVGTRYRTWFLCKTNKYSLPSLQPQKIPSNIIIFFLKVDTISFCHKNAFKLK